MEILFLNVSHSFHKKKSLISFVSNESHVKIVSTQMVKESPQLWAALDCLKLLSISVVNL